MVLGESNSQHLKFGLSSHYQRSSVKNLKVTLLLIVDLSKSFDSKHWKGGVNTSRKEIVTNIMNRKAMVCSSDGDRDFFDVITGVLQKDTLAYFYL